MPDEPIQPGDRVWCCRASMETESYDGATYVAPWEGTFIERLGANAVIGFGDGSDDDTNARALCGLADFSRDRDAIRDRAAKAMRDHAADLRRQADELDAEVERFTSQG